MQDQHELLEKMMQLHESTLRTIQEEKALLSVKMNGAHYDNAQCNEHNLLENR